MSVKIGVYSMKVNCVSSQNNCNFKSVDRVVVWSNKSGEWVPSSDFDENRRVMRLLVRRANGRNVDETSSIHEKNDVIRCLCNGNKDYKRDVEKYRNAGNLSLDRMKMSQGKRGEGIVNAIYDMQGGWKGRGQFMPISYIVTGKEQEELRNIGEQITAKRRLYKMHKCTQQSIEAKIKEYIDYGERLMRQAGDNILHILAQYQDAKPYKLIKLEYFLDSDVTNPMMKKFIKCLHK